MSKSRRPVVKSIKKFPRLDLVELGLSLSNKEATLSVQTTGKLSLLEKLNQKIAKTLNIMGNKLPTNTLNRSVRASCSPRNASR